MTTSRTILRGNLDSLIEAFPCLVRKCAPEWPNDANRWIAWMEDNCHSSGEWITATFLLHVWNWRENAVVKPERFRFDFGRAMNTWDEEHLAVFATWARAPWYK